MCDVVAGTKSVDWKIKLCTVDKYCPAGSSVGVVCPSGTNSVGLEGLRDVFECSNITTGTGTAKGYYHPPGSPVAIKTPAGTYIDVIDQTSHQEAKNCGFGKFCVEGSLAAADCLAGTYADELRLGACKDCPAGSKCATNVLKNHVHCNEGEYSDAKATACIKCPKGYYCHEKGTSITTMLTQKCTAGSYCVSGTDGIATFPDTITNACKPGFYCPEATTSEIPCPAGTYNLAEARESLLDCLESPAGYFSAAGTYDYRIHEC
jgi:hypothetical protein